jgi:hypothetical protein
MSSIFTDTQLSSVCKNPLALENSGCIVHLTRECWSVIVLQGDESWNSDMKGALEYANTFYMNIFI